jgi:hypothetical protein
MPEFDIQTAKEQINNFLWQILPPTTTLSEAEDVAIEFLNKIDEAWCKHGERRSTMCAKPSSSK